MEKESTVLTFVSLCVTTTFGIVGYIAAVNLKDTPYMPGLLVAMVFVTILVGLAASVHRENESHGIGRDAATSVGLAFASALMFADPYAKTPGGVPGWFYGFLLAFVALIFGGHFLKEVPVVERVAKWLRG